MVSNVQLHTKLKIFIITQTYKLIDTLCDLKNHNAHGENSRHFENNLR